jgi:hemerythrin superfamily protein
MAHTTGHEEHPTPQGEAMPPQAPHGLVADPTAMIKADHDLVEALFTQFEQATGDNAQREGIAEQIFQALEAHTQLEEEILYPVARTEVYEQGDLMMDDFQQAHATVKDLIEQLQHLNPRDSAYLAMFQELMEDVRTHAEEEESTLLPDLDGLPTDQLEQLAMQLQQRKEELTPAML